MTDFEQKIMNRLELLETQIEELRASRTAADKAVDFEALPAAATVGKDYVAYRFGCSENSVVRRESGTHLCRRVSNKPLKFIKREVDEAWRKFTRPPKEIAAELTAQANIRKR